MNSILTRKQDPGKRNPVALESFMSLFQGFPSSDQAPELVAKAPFDGSLDDTDATSTLTGRKLDSTEAIAL